MKFATRMNRLVSSPVRDLLALTENPEMVSFAGGLPSADSFPAVDALCAPVSALQYGASEGDWPLRERIATLVRARGLDCKAEQVLVLSGSQQGIDLVAKMMVDSGTRVALEVPTYLAALQVFSLFGADYHPFAPGDAPPPAELIYVNPSFQNPTGHCYTAREREQVRHHGARSGAVLFEDDPYHDLCFDNCERTPLVAGFDGEWVYQGSFSKSLCPGLRLGFLVASDALIGPLTQLKQASDLHSNRIAQAWVLQWLDSPDAPERRQQLISLYTSRRDFFAGVLDEYFADIASWQLPQGGLFFWLRLHDAEARTDLMLQRALAQQVVFMPGNAFYPDANHPDALRTLRLNFSNAKPADVVRGLCTLASVVRSGQG